MKLEDASSTRPEEAFDLVSTLQLQVQRWPQRAAFTYLVDGEDDTIFLTFEELDRRARAIAAELIARGLSGRRALLLYPSGLEFVTALFGCIYANVVAIPAFPPRRNRNMVRLQAIANDAKATIALTTADASSRIESLVHDGDSSLGQIQWMATDRVASAGADRWQRPDIRPERLAVLQYTSGSTGQPKGVMLSHENLLANCKVIQEAFSATSDDVIMTWLPTYHDMGLIGGIIEPVFLGSPVIMMSPMAFLQKPVRWLSAITKHRATIAGGPNFAYDLCTKKVTEEQMASLDLSHLTLAFNGAEPVRQQTLTNFANKFARCGFRHEAFHPCYGMAESSLMITGGFRYELPKTSRFDADQLDAGAVSAVEDSQSGRALIGCGNVSANHNLVIVDPQSSKILPSGKVGEVWVTGPSVGMGYLNQPELTQATFQNQLAEYPGQNFLRTGDLGFLHDGQIYVNGRIKDMIIVRGVNKYPQDIEMTVECADDRLRTGSAAAFAFEKDGREHLVIVAEAERIANSNWDEVIDSVRASVAREHDLAPDAIVLIRAGSIPKTSSGKIQRHACRDGFLSDTLLEIAHWERSDRQRETESHASLFHTEERSFETLPEKNVLDVIYRSVRAVARERVTELNPDSNVVEMGLDSLERVDIVRRIENALEITFSAEELLAIETCGELADTARGKVTQLTRRAAEDIPAADYRFEEAAEYKQLKRTQDAFESYGIPMPYFGVHEGAAQATTVVNGRELVNFASYNYLGLSGDPDVNRAAQAAIARYGTSVSASRIVSGERPIHRQLENEIASMLGVDDALAFVGGHSTNETTIGHLFGNRDLVLHDSLAHNSIIQGALLSGAERRPFAHNDWQALDEILSEHRTHYRRALVAIEGAYSMDGDYPNLPKFIEVAKRHRAYLMVDEAHSAGTMGKSGRGLGEHFEVDRNDVDIWMGTLSKSFGSCGGYIAGGAALVEYLRYTAPGFIYSVGMPPSNAAAALAAIRKMLADPERVRRCQQRSKLFLKLANQVGLDTGLSLDTPVVPVILGNSRTALALSHQLAKRGINVQPIMHPAVAESAARLRFFVTSEHSEAQIERTVIATAEALAKIRGDVTRFQPSPHFLDRSSVSEVPKRAV